MSENILDISAESTTLFENHLSELTTYTRKNESEVIDLISNCMTNRNNEWDKYSENSIIDFHRLNESSVYCLTKWNCEEKYQAIMRYISYIAKMNGGSILDFGGGIGELTISLVNKYSNVDFMEVPGNTLEYAKWRFKRRSLNIEVFTSLNQIKKKYDLIICLDVLEVLEKPQSHISKFHELLNDNGILILSQGEVGSKAHPMNLERNRDFIQNLDKYCTELGFKGSKYENKYHLKIKQKI